MFWVSGWTLPSLPRRSATKKRNPKRPTRPILEELETRDCPSLLGQQLFPDDNAWNQKITNAPVAATSTAVMNLITNNGTNNVALHPDFGQGFGIPYNVVHGNSTAKISVVIDNYPGESDVVPAPISANAMIEGDPASKANRGDSHLIVWDEDNNIDYEFFGASRPSENADGKWHAAQETVWNMNTNTFRTLGFTSADAAGLAILPGLARPDEALPTSQGGQGVIDHALRFTLTNSVILDQFIYPASHVANSNTNASNEPPMGARFRLKANVDISKLDPESKIIAQAMKDYGLILADNGSNMFVSGAGQAVNANNNIVLNWDDNDIQSSTHGLKALKASDFEMVDLTPIVSSLSTTSGAAGTSVTITGLNFSGAAGHLKVLFGNTTASSFTILDDSHITVTAPAGTGTVDVRVQSGTNVSNTQDIKNPIFGYGISTTSVNDKFTYGGTSNHAPTVATAAAGSPLTVTGLTSALSVLGADDGGEAALTYTWAATTLPSGASPSFSANGTNAAKNSTVTFNKAGSYTFTVTIKDTSGLTTTSSVNVAVNQTLSSISVSPTSTSVTLNGSQQFAASAKDQFGALLSVQPAFTWSLVSGPGSISTSGLFTAGATAGSATVKATSGSISSTATAAVGNTAPGIATAAGSAPNPVTGKTANLSVLGKDDGGEAALTYTWAATTIPSGATPTFSANGTNASKNSTVTFNKAGSYTFTVTVKDASGLTTTSSVNVAVNQTLTAILLSPSSAAIGTGATQQFTASAKDQFGASLTTQPAFTWSIISGVGTINASGLYSAGSAAGSAVVKALSGSASATANVTVTQTQSSQSPFGGTAWPIPGKIEAENFDNGGEGVAYHDLDSSNNGGSFRTTEAVDIQGTSDTGGGFNVGWIQAGEWLKYTVNVSAAGSYDLSLRLANNAAGGALHVEVDGVNVTGTLAVPNTGDWQIWSTVTKTGINLTAGQHVVKVSFDTAGTNGWVANLNWLSFAASTQRSTVRTQAQSLTLAGNYLIEQNSAASSGSLIRVASGGQSGTASGTFNGPAGNYRIVVAYYDESDGASTLKFSLNGTQLDSWVLNQNTTGSSVADATDRFTRTVATTVSLKPGDKFTLTALADLNEFARIDYIDFVPV